MRAHRLMVAALLAFCVHGGLGASDDDGSWVAHESAWGATGLVNVMISDDGSWLAHEAAWGGSGGLIVMRDDDGSSLARVTARKPEVATRVAAAKTAPATTVTVFSFGKREFAEKCASCHGPKAKGDGVNKPLLDRSPPDLTVLAKTHGGEFPYDEFYTAVDGRVAEHTDMPCFANIYMEASRSDYMDVPYDEDRYMDTRLVALANYVNALQER